MEHHGAGEQEPLPALRPRHKEERDRQSHRAGAEVDGAASEPWIVPPLLQRAERGVADGGKQRQQRRDERRLRRALDREDERAHLPPRRGNTMYG